MDDDGWLYGVLTIIVIGLSFFIPRWIADAAGYAPAHIELVAWWKSQEPLIKWPAFVAYGLAGFTVLAAAFAGVIAVVAAVVSGSIRASDAAYRALRKLVMRFFSFLGTYITLFFWLLFWPVRAVFGWIWEEIEDRIPELKLRRTYRTRSSLRRQFGSYREFREHWDQHAEDDGVEDEDGAFEEAYESEGREETPDGDLIRAMGVLHLSEPFTKADLNKQFNELMKVLHSDKGKVESDEFAKELNWARSTIMERMDLS